MIYERFQAVARGQPDRPAVIDAGGAVTYARLLARSDAVAEALARTAGVGEADRVLVFLPNSADFVTLFLAAARLGAAVMPIDPTLTDREIGAYIRRFELRAAVMSADFRRHRAVALAGLAEQRRLTIDPPPDGPGDAVPPRRAGPFAGALAALSTSGSTGSPRVVARTQRGLLAGVSSLNQVLKAGPEDRVLGVVPFRHSHGLGNAMLLSLLSGATLVVMERFLPRVLIDVVAEHRVSVLIGSPFIFSTVAECVEDRSAFASVRTAISSAAALPPATAGAFLDKTGVSIRDLYGSTETGCIAVADPDEIPGAGTARPLPGVEVRVVDDRGTALAPGETGEVLVRSAIMATQYLAEKGGGAAAFALRDGFHPMGDLGHIDAHGNLVLEGRTSPLRLNIAGVKVDPVEIERVILGLPQVAKVMVSGVAGPRGMDVIKATVVAAGGCELAREALIAHCRRALAEYKVPRIVEVVDALPENIMGKRGPGSPPARPGS